MEKAENKLQGFLKGLGLSDRQVQISEGVVKGMSNKEIAVSLEITEKTVKGTLTLIYKKVGVPSRAMLIVKSIPYLDLGVASEVSGS